MCDWHCCKHLSLKTARLSMELLNLNPPEVLQKCCVWVDRQGWLHCSLHLFTCSTTDGAQREKPEPGENQIDRKQWNQWFLPHCLSGRCRFVSHRAVLEPHLPYLSCTNEFTHRISLIVSFLCIDLLMKYPLTWKTNKQQPGGGVAAFVIIDTWATTVLGNLEFMLYA